MLAILEDFEQVLDGPGGGPEGADCRQSRLSSVIITLHQHALILFIFASYTHIMQPASCKVGMFRLSEMAKLLPPLSYNSVKGSSGTVGIIGGSFEYTGAPFYSAMAALKMGADISHIFCPKEAAIPIKSYSPEIIVHPVFDYNSAIINELSKAEMESLIEKWIVYLRSKFERIKCWVVGPGLGRTKLMSHFFKKFIEELPAKANIVIDADGLYFLCQHPQLVEKLGNLNSVLTPNHQELKHLNKFLLIKQENLEVKPIEQRVEEFKEDHDVVGCQQDIEQEFTFSIVVKGKSDVVLHRGQRRTVVTTRGSKKRCGGIGDVLAGCIATCCLWNYDKGPALACHVVKHAADMACIKHGRSLTGLGVLQFVSDAIRQLEQKII